MSQSLSGQLFRADHHVLLCTVAKARQWKGSVWVPAKVAARLQLPLIPDTVAPVQLEGSNGTNYVYHSDQFTVPLSALRDAWNAYVKRECHLTSSLPTHTGSHNLPPSGAVARVFPLSTNGERFDPETEERLLKCSDLAGVGGDLTKSSSYWATAAEAAYVFNSPFREAYLADPKHVVVSNASPLCRPLLLYNVEGTVNPACFTTLTCRRYDPVNHEGCFYRPSVAVSMKAFAIRHHCLHERQWITTRRAAFLGLSVPRNISPISSFFSNPVHLVNVAVLQRSALICGRLVSSSVSPSGAKDEAESANLLESELLVSSDCGIRNFSNTSKPRIPTVPS